MIVNEEDLIERTKEALRFVGVRMGDNGLSLAPNKRTIREMSVCMEGRMIETREAMRYLGGRISKKLQGARASRTGGKESKNGCGCPGPSATQCSRTQSE